MNISYMKKLESKINNNELFENEPSFLFSFVIPIYNVEEYLEETLESVINQSLDFESHSQIVLVNDGSPDNSEEICIKFKNKYPNNIIYISKENGGVSSARNLGAEYATGKYINFLDSDDILDHSALEKVLKFFNVHDDQVDAVALPIHYFEAKTGQHLLSYKFTKTRVINLENNPMDIQMHVSSVFFKREAILGILFDTDLKYGEDAKFFTEIMVKKGAYGVISDTTYHYRIRHTQNSAIQTSKFSKNWYTDCLDNFSIPILNLAKSTFGYIPKYFQHLVMYDLQWKLKLDSLPSDVLDENEKNEFLTKAHFILQSIDDDVIAKQKYLDFQQKFAILKLKNHSNDSKKLYYLNSENDVSLYYGTRLIDRVSATSLNIDVFNFENSSLIVEGFIGSAFDKDDIKVICYLDDTAFETTIVNRPLKTRKMWDMNIKEINGFQLKLDLKDVDSLSKLSFKLKINNQIVPIKYNLLASVPFSKKIPSYYATKDFIAYPLKKEIVIVPYSMIRKIKKELGLQKRLLKIAKKKNSAYKAIVVRTIYHILKPFVKTKPIYLFMDRNDKAGDNAEALFDYANKIDDGIKKYFVLESDSEDIERIKKIGKVIPFGTYRHKLMLLLADQFISSHADEALINPFGTMRTYYKDLLQYKFVFLQHGITQNDLSVWLNKYNKNIKTFITSTKEEYKSILEGNYGYSEKEVKLTGMPRHDYLKMSNKDEKNILIMPTWRKNLATNLNKDYVRPYSDSFKDSEYFNIFSRLLNDLLLQDVMKSKNIKIQFILHPCLKQQISDFKIYENDVIQVLDSDKLVYKDLFNSASLMITDYSSVAFDFAYLHKPIIYFQFDNQEFFNSHLSKDYFDYETMGFGPVVSEIPDLIKEIISQVNKNFKYETSSEYFKRIDSFFEFSDSSNSKRVYDSIKLNH